MQLYPYPLTFAALLTVITVSNATTTFSTNFDRSEGYISSALDQSKQTSAAHFNEAPFAAGFYLPEGGKPDFGTLRRAPNAIGASAYYKIGVGSALTAGATYSVTLDVTFEGLPARTPSTDAFMGSVGFSTSSKSNTHAIFAGIKRNASGLNSAAGMYQFFVSGGGYAEVMGGVSYTALGDDRLDDDDITDNLRVVFSLNKSATPGQFEAVAQLINLDTSDTVATITTTLTESTAYQSDLFGYFRSGSIKEEGNFDLFNIDAFSYTAAAIKP